MSHPPSPLRRTVTDRPTDFWNDSCAPDELQYAIDHGAVGATSNPTIVVDGVKKDPERWKNHIAELIWQNPSWTEVDIAWKVSEEFAVAGAKLLEPIFQATEGRKGHLSIQTNPQYFCSKDELVKQAVYFNTLAPNLHVKAPATHAGVQAMEEMTYQGVRINATVSFTVPQVVAMAEGVDRALRRREEEGKSNDHLHPVITMMVGRTDDWLKVVAGKEGRVPTPGVLDWAGVACFKNAYRIFQQKGYRARLLAAAYRNHLHWSQFIGGDVVLTIPSGWQKKFNKSNVEVKDRMDDPVPQEILDELNTYEDFRRAYSPDGMTTEEFDSFGATRRTLRGFLASYADLLAFVREQMVPSPD